MANNNRNSPEITALIREIKQYIEQKNFPTALSIIDKGLIQTNHKSIDLLLLGGYCATQADKLDNAETYLVKGIDIILANLASLSTDNSLTSTTTIVTLSNPLITSLNQARQGLLEVYKRKNNVIGQIEILQLLRNNLLTLSTISLSDLVFSITSQPNLLQISTIIENTYVQLTNEQCLTGESLRQIDLTIRISLLIYQYYCFYLFC